MPTTSGGLESVPRCPAPPAQACTVASVAGRPAHGPVSPNGVIAVTVAPGARSCSAAGENSGRSARAEPGDQTMPFARPLFSELLQSIDFAIAKDYPARGEYDGPV